MENKVDQMQSPLPDAAMLSVVAGTLDKAGSFVKHFDTQTNVIVGFSSAITLFAITILKTDSGNLPALILAGFSVTSVLVGFYAIHPPRFMRKKGQEESLLYSKRVSSLPSAKVYAEKLREMLSDRDEVINQYSIEIYNLYTYYYKPKRFLFKISRNLLVIGLIASLATFLFLK